MKIRFKGNTSKIKKFFPATEDKPATLYVDVAEKIKNRDGSETTIWHKVRVYSSGKVGWVYAKYVKITGYAPDSGYTPGYDPVPSSATSGSVSTKYPNSIVNLRAGAGTHYAVLGAVGRGTRLNILSSQGNWFQVYVPSRGITAWISKTYVSMGVGAYATGDVNLRTGPGTDYARITVIKKGSGLTMLSEGGSWSQVSYGGYTGYISNKYWAYR